MRAKQIESLPEFDRWCIHPAKMVDGPAHWDDEERPKAKLLVYFTKDGNLHLERVTAEGEIVYHQTFQPLYPHRRIAQCLK